MGSNAGEGKDAPGANPSVPKNTFKNNYVLGEILGEGAFSVVKLATHKQTKQKVAVKIINKSGLSEVDELSLRQEVAILKDLKHPNIVGLVDYYEEPKEFLIALEFLRKCSILFSMFLFTRTLFISV